MVFILNEIQRVWYITRDRNCLAKLKAFKRLRDTYLTMCECDFFPLAGGVDRIDGDAFGTEDVERRLLAEIGESEAGARRSTT